MFRSLDKKIKRSKYLKFKFRENNKNFMSGISSIYILDNKGRVLITRAYRDDLSHAVLDVFNNKLIEFTDETAYRPVFIDNGIAYFHIQVNNLIFLLVAQANVNVTMIFSFMYKMIEVFNEYFHDLEEESVRDNFVVIYELLDEMLDNGYPQTTEHKILKEFIKTESHELYSEKRPDIANIPSAISNAISWRAEGIKYKKNEIFLDITEKVNMIVSKSGNVIKSEVVGSLLAKSFLSGMPECKLGLNDKALFELEGKNNKTSIDLSDVKFHQCVRLSRFENERTISFIPPDGEFELISYRMDMSFKSLFMVDVVVESRTFARITFHVKAQTFFKSKCIAQDVMIYIPVPCDAQSPSFKAGNGLIEYLPDRDCMVWNIKEFPGQSDLSMSASFSLPSVTSPERDNFLKVPIQIEFEIPYYTISGIQVRYLKITDKSGYEGSPWVRYVTKHGNYQIRMGGN